MFIGHCQVDVFHRRIFFQHRISIWQITVCCTRKTFMIGKRFERKVVRIPLNNSTKKHFRGIVSPAYFTLGGKKSVAGFFKGSNRSLYRDFQNPNQWSLISADRRYRRNFYTCFVLYNNSSMFFVRPPLQ